MVVVVGNVTVVADYHVSDHGSCDQAVTTVAVTMLPGPGPHQSQLSAMRAGHFRYQQTWNIAGACPRPGHC